MSVTLRDVAKAAGVHTTTVSSILNRSKGNSRFSEATRARVQAEAKRLGYTTDRIATSLRTRRTKTIGLVAGIIQNPFFAALSLHLEHHLRLSGYDLVLTCHGTDASHNECDLARMLMGRSVDGLLIWSEGRHGSPKIPGDAETPRVWIGYGPRGEPSVLLDDAAGLRLAVAHLQARGCTRLGYYGPCHASTTGLPKNRLTTFQGVCAAYALPPPVPLLFAGQDYDLGDATACAESLIGKARSEGVQGVVGYNDVAAAGWHLVARTCGFDCPLVGFDGSPLIKAWRPAIPHVDVHIDKLAKQAVDLLLALVRGENPDRQRLHVQPTLVV